MLYARLTLMLREWSARGDDFAAQRIVAVWAPAGAGRLGSRICAHRAISAILAALGILLVFGERPAGAQTVLACGDVVNESISAPLEQDHFTFFGEQGDTVTLTLVETGEIDAGFTVFGHRFTPNSTTPIAVSQGITNWTLPETGTYTVRIFDLADTRRGNYAIRLAWLLPLNKQCGEHTTLICGQLANGSVGTPLEQDQFTFSGQQGDVVTLTLVETGETDPGFLVFGHRFTPNSAAPVALSQGITNWTLPETGTYTVRIFDLANTRRGNYSVRLTWLLPVHKQCGDRTALSCGQVVNGAVTTPLEQDQFTFSGQQGEAVTLTLAETGEIDPGFLVFGHRFTPNSDLPIALGQGITNWTLPATGTYIVRIFDLANARRGNYSLRLGAVGACPLPPPPGPPTSLVGSVAGSIVTLNWSAPSTGGAPASYVIEAGAEPGSSNLAIFDTGNSSTSFTAGGVPLGTFFVRVRAKNAAGTSAPSNEVILVVGPGTLPPGPPTNLVASVVGSTVNLNWAAPSTGGAVASYVLEAGKSPGDSSVAVFATGTILTSFTAFSVPPGVYFVRIRARNGSGTSGASNEVVIVVGGCTAAPSPPGPLTSTVSGNVVRVAWTAPNSTVSTYVIDVGSSPGASNLGSFATGNVDTSLTAIATPGTYYVRVRARNACGTSAPSNEVAVAVF